MMGRLYTLKLLAQSIAVTAIAVYIVFSFVTWDLTWYLEIPHLSVQERIQFAGVVALALLVSSFFLTE